ncbi:MAG: hypothetical protein NVV60_01610 [Luteimonas sp.]|nr:hypothetical protein [Luteimonas sp.]
MSLTHRGTPHGRRIAAARAAMRTPGYVRSPGAECTGNPLGERLGIAAIYAGKGDDDNAQAAALLAVVDVRDTPENRIAVMRHIDQVAQLVRDAVNGGNA